MKKVSHFFEKTSHSVGKTVVLFFFCTVYHFSAEWERITRTPASQSLSPQSDTHDNHHINLQAFSSKIKPSRFRQKFWEPAKINPRENGGNLDNDPCFQIVSTINKLRLKRARRAKFEDRYLFRATCLKRNCH